MARFSTAPIAEVAPQRKQRRTSQREQMQLQYRGALQGAINAGDALVIELEPEDKALTIRNRITRASKVLGLEDLIIRRKGNRIMAYRQSADECA